MNEFIRLGLATLIVGVAASMYVMSSSFSGMGSWFPSAIGLAATIVAACNLIIEVVWIRRSRRSLVGSSSGPAVATQRATPKFDLVTSSTDGADVIQAALWLLVILSYSATIYLVGIMLGSALWLAIMLRLVARRGWFFVIVSVVLVLAMLQGYSSVLGLRLPSSVLFN